jgi:hypothetical protein
MKALLHYDSMNFPIECNQHLPTGMVEYQHPRNQKCVYIPAVTVLIRETNLVPFACLGAQLLLALKCDWLWKRNGRYLLKSRNIIFNINIRIMLHMWVRIYQTNKKMILSACKLKYISDEWFLTVHYFNLYLVFKITGKPINYV